MRPSNGLRSGPAHRFRRREASRAQTGQSAMTATIVSHLCRITNALKRADTPVGAARLSRSAPVSALVGSTAARSVTVVKTVSFLTSPAPCREVTAVQAPPQLWWLGRVGIAWVCRSALAVVVDPGAGDRELEGRELAR
jgi:hypothetical protein